MNAWKWETSLFYCEELESLRAQPCETSMDNRLLVLAEDWFRALNELCIREILDIDRRSIDCWHSTFSQHLYLVHKLYEMVARFRIGNPLFRRTPDDHQTFSPYTPRSDVTQARFAIATLAKMGFGTWLESLQKGNWRLSRMAMVYDFVFDRSTGTLCWANINDRDDALNPRPRMILDLILPNLTPATLESIPSPTECPSTNSFILNWLDEAPEIRVPCRNMISRENIAELGGSGAICTQYCREAENQQLGYEDSWNDSCYFPGHKAMTFNTKKEEILKKDKATHNRPIVMKGVYRDTEKAENPQANHPIKQEEQVITISSQGQSSGPVSGITTPTTPRPLVKCSKEVQCNGCSGCIRRIGIYKTLMSE